MVKLTPNMNLKLETERNPFIYYVPGQILNPLSIFAFWCAHKMGEVPPPGEVRVVSTSLSGVPVKTIGYMVPPLFTGKGKNELTRQTSELPSSWVLKRLVNYLSYCLPDQKLYPLATLERIKASPYLYGQMTIAALRLWREPQLALLAGTRILDRVVDNKIDPFTAGELSGDDRWVLEELREVTKDATAEIQSSMDKILRRADRGIGIPVTIYTQNREVEVERKVGRLALLENQKVSLAVVGPANVGKSTMVANLEHAGRRLVELAGMTPELWSLAVPCLAVDFDASTPDIGRIQQGEPASFSADQKMPWTMSLATGVVRDYVAADKGIYFVSTPGGKPDNITTTLALPLDCAILLLKAATQAEWDSEYRVWSEVLRSNGVVPLALVRSRRVGENTRFGTPAESSALTNISWRQRGEFAKQDWLGQVRGRLVGPHREIVDGDAFYTDLAKLLLLDLLPGLVVDKYHAALNYANTIFQKYKRFGGWNQ